MFWKRPPIWLLQVLLPDVLWRNSNAASDTVHLTFDDGPSTHTEAISDLLVAQGHRATFFLSGKQIELFPSSPVVLASKGHVLGYHGYGHLDAWKCSHEAYMQDLEKGISLFDAKLLRPAYGHLTWKQYRLLRKRYKLVMWDLMPGDFLPKKTAIETSKFVLEHVIPGSIIVLHDQEHMGSKSLETLQLILDGLKQKGLHSEALR